MADFIVLNTNDSGVGSLRQAIADADASGDLNNNITFDAALAGQTITLSSLLAWNNAGNLTIDGDTDGINGVDNGVARGITISGGDTTRLFTHQGTEGQDSLTLTNLTLADGFSNSSQTIAAILSIGDLRLDNVLFTGNTAAAPDAPDGPGDSADIATLIGNSGRMTLSDVIFDETNVVSGGAGSDTFGPNGGNGSTSSLIFNNGTILASGFGMVVFGGTVTGGRGGNADVNGGDGGDAVGIQNFGTVENLTIDTNNFDIDLTVTAGAGGSGNTTNGTAGSTEERVDDVGGGTSSTILELGDRSGTFGDDQFLQPLNGTINGFAGNDVLDGFNSSDVLLGGSGRDTIDGNGGIDTIRGGDDADVIIGGTESDQLFGDAGDDIFVLFEGDDGAGPENINGGADVDALRFVVSGEGTGILDLSNDTISSIEQFEVQGLAADLPSVNVTLGEDQFQGNGTLDATLRVFGTNDDNEIVFTINANGGINLSGLAFNNFGDANDRIVTNIAASGGFNFVTASGVADEINGSTDSDFFILGEGDGTDTVRGGDNRDTLVFQGGTGDTAGEVFDGGDGGDNADQMAFSVSGGTDNTFDLTGATVSEFEEFAFVSNGSPAGAVNVTLNSSHLNENGGVLQGAFAADQLNATDVLTFTVNVDQFTANFSGLGFSGFDGPGRDFVIQGNGIGNIITGTTGDDQINGGGGADTLAGGNGIDVLRGELGDDIFLIDVADPEAANDTFDGGGDTDTVQIGANGEADGTFALDNATFHSIERLELEDSNVGGTLLLQLGSNQFGLQPGMGMGQGISGTAEFELDGFDDNTEVVQVFMRGTNLDLSGLTFLGDTTNARFELLGDGHTGESITGSSLRDIITGGGSDGDTLNGGGGDDLITGNIDGDVIDGGTNDAGGDTLTYEGGGIGVRVNLDTGRGRGGDAEGDLISNVENLIGTDQNDALTGNGDANNLTGGGGIDTLLAGGGADVLDGEAGNDRLFGLDGNDTINGGLDNDFALGGNNDDLINGDGGADRLLGNNGNDTINGGTENDTLNGGGGLDALFGGSGVDDLTGGGANDTVEGGLGNDIIKGGSGLDVLRGDEGDDNLFGDVGSDTLFGGADNDILNGFQGLDQLFGEGGNDTLSGGDNADTLDGGADDDILRGQGANDNLLGGAGADNLNGGANNDTLDGGTENDFLIGDTGNDTFVFAAGSGFDQINDFDDLGNDVVDLTAFGFVDFAADVQANLAESGPHVDLVLGGDTLRFRNTDIATLTEDDFILSI